MTEKLLLLGGAIQVAGTVKGRKAKRFATSDWMELEKERGISITTSVMQFPYGGKMFNLLDTPGHEDFSEDTYRTLTAVDSALMLIDAVKGVEERTIKLMEVCRLRTTPIITFINKLDRDAKNPLELLDEIEKVLKIKCAPITWPIGCGRDFKGVYNFIEQKFKLYKELDGFVVDEEELALMQGAANKFDLEEYLQGKLTPVFFGSALNDFGVQELLDAFVSYAPAPHAQTATSRQVLSSEPNFSGFVFKIQANMDLQHRDRIAFLRICSGKYTPGMKVRHVRLNKDILLNNALTFMAGERERIIEGLPGDIIGIHNHGTIQINDSFTQGENLKFSGIPYFAPELFRSVRPKDPLKAKALQKGLIELSEEGATQVFRPLKDNRIILGAVGVLQFDVVAHRLKYEYNVECIYDNVAVATARWVTSSNAKKLAELQQKAYEQLALDHGDNLTYLAPNMVNLNLTIERWPDIEFHKTREL